MNDSFIEKLRSITEEEDLNTILKASIGGYTKKSVQEYLSVVKKQQQTLQSAYVKELDRVQAEKDELAAKAADLKQQLEQSISRCNAEAEAQMLQYKEQIEKLKADKESLEKDMDEAIAKIREDEGRVQSISEMEEANSALNSKVKTLAANCEMLKRELEIRSAESEGKDSRIETLSRQEAGNHALLERLQEDLGALKVQNECLESENNELAERLKQQLEQNIALSREIAKIKVSNAALQRKIEAERINNAGGTVNEGDSSEVS